MATIEPADWEQYLDAVRQLPTFYESAKAHIVTKAQHEDNMELSDSERRAHATRTKAAVMLFQDYGRTILRIRAKYNTDNHFPLLNLEEGAKQYRDYCKDLGIEP
jgi:hypothetical protein